MYDKRVDDWGDFEFLIRTNLPQNLARVDMCIYDRFEYIRRTREEAVIDIMYAHERDNAFDHITWGHEIKF